MPTYYIAITGDPTDFECEQVSTIERETMREAAIAEADRIFEEEGVDPMSPIDIIIADDATGVGAMLFKVRRVVDIRHEIDSEREIDVPRED